jgi:acetyl-CoA C-acetyltransferase
LGAIAVKEAVSRAGVEPKQVTEVIMGNVVGAGLGQNPARQATIFAGLPPEVWSMTINKVCGSGLKAVALASQAVILGDSEVVVAGGLESMSQAPYMLPKARTGYRLGNGTLVDAMVWDGLWDKYENFHMGNTGELVAEKYGISREEQDEYACNSHKKAVAAIEAGLFKEEITPVTIKGRKGQETVVDTDEGPRKDTTVEALARLKPVFKKDGTVTAGNAPGVNDGASALVVMTEEKAKALGVTPIARVTGYTQSGIEPKWVMMAPVKAVQNLMAKTGSKIDDYELVELNEAFSVQALACVRELGIDPERVNVHGGAVALGHPIGATGARILTTLLHALKNQGKSKGLASLCLGGGNAVALSVEMM